MFKFILTAFILVLLLYLIHYLVKHTQSNLVIYGIVGLIILMSVVFVSLALKYIKELGYEMFLS